MAIDGVVEEIAEEIADNLEEAAVVTRRINAHSVGLLLSGLVVGAAVGFYFGYRYNKEKIKAEAFEESEKEIEKIRETYRAKMKAAEPKPTVEEVIEERGYAQERPLKPPVPVREPITPVPTSTVGIWDYEVEIAERLKNPDQPYVIHQDEFNEKSDYAHVTYTYYAVDDVLVDDENEHPLPHADLIVGQYNLKFGYGTDHEDVVFIRNDKLELEMEICRVPQSYEVEVLGLDDSNEST
jgi:hypothetical protein